jgi:hypothetical protein
VLGAALSACGGTENSPASVDLRFQRVSGAVDPGPGFRTHQGSAARSGEQPYVTGIAVPEQSPSTVQSVTIEVHCQTWEADIGAGDLEILVTLDQGHAAPRVFRSTSGHGVLASDGRTAIQLDRVLVEDGHGNTFLVSGQAAWYDQPETD